MFSKNRSPANKNGGQNGIHCWQQAPIMCDYVYNNYKNNNVSGFYLITTIMWSLAYGCGQQWNQRRQKIHVKRWQFWWSCGYGGAMRSASPNGAYPWLHAKPLDAAIRWVPVLYCPGGCHGWRFQMKQKNTTKTQLLPSFLTVDQCKKTKQFLDPKRTLYLGHQCNKLCTNVKQHYSSWRAQLHLELSKVVNRQKFEKLLTLNEAKKPVGHIWPYSG